MTTSNVSIEVKLNKSDSTSFDQNQLYQITQLINDFQQQQQQQQLQQQPTSSPQQNPNILGNAECFSLNDLNFQLQQQQQQNTFQNMMEISVAPDQSQSNPNYNNNIGINMSPSTMIKFENNQFPNEQQQQSQQQEVHTIMLNGQPALFIPASSAMSSNLLCQLMMNNQMNANQFDFSNNQNMGTDTNNFASILGNNQQFILSNENNTAANEQIEQTPQLENHIVLNNNNTIQLSGEDLNSFASQVNMSGFNCNMEGINQPQQIVINSNNNQISNDMNQQQQQQIICIQPDGLSSWIWEINVIVLKVLSLLGNIMFQSLPFLIQSTQQPQQATIEFNSAVNLSPNKLPVAKTAAGKAKKQATTTKTKPNTVASALANSSNCPAKTTKPANDTSTKITAILNTADNSSGKTNQTNEPMEMKLSPNQNISYNNVVFTVNSTNENQQFLTMNNSSEFVENAEFSMNGLKRKRKACDCPNCIKSVKFTFFKPFSAQFRMHNYF